VSYQTAWLKANHPVEFMAAVMNCDIHLTDKLNAYVQEVRRLGIPLDPPCVNRSGATFAVRDGRVQYALGALRNVGVEAMRLIEAARGDRPFRDLADFAGRVDLRRVGKRPLEMLARAGAFDGLDSNRGAVLLNLDALIAHSAAALDERASAQVSLFGEANVALPPPRLATAPPWSTAERLAAEHLAVGFYLSGHPLDDHMAALGRQRVMTLATLTAQARGGGTGGRIAGSVASRQEKKSARGNRFAFVELSDPTGFYEVTVFADTLEASRELLEPGSNVVLTVEAELQGEALKILARSVEPADRVAAAAPPAGLRIHVADEAAVGSVRLRLDEARDGRRGPVHLVLTPPGLEAEVELALPDGYGVTPRVRSAIRSLPGVVHVEDF
jgi:DNA polymerase-3 subunit alpha